MKSYTCSRGWFLHHVSCHYRCGSCFCVDGSGVTFVPYASPIVAPTLRMHTNLDAGNVAPVPYLILSTSNNRCVVSQDLMQHTSIKYYHSFKATVSKTFRRLTNASRQSRHRSVPRDRVHRCHTQQVHLSLTRCGYSFGYLERHLQLFWRWES